MSDKSFKVNSQSSVITLARGIDAGKSIDSSIDGFKKAVENITEFEANYQREQYADVKVRPASLHILAERSALKIAEKDNAEAKSAAVLRMPTAPSQK